MRPPAFWAAGPDHPAARALAPVGAAYGALVARRMDRPGARACCPVLCLGNFTLGGAGKTPAALAVAATTATPDEPLAAALGVTSFDSGVTQTPQAPASMLATLRGRSATRFAGEVRRESRVS